MRTLTPLLALALLLQVSASAQDDRPAAPREALVFGQSPNDPFMVTATATDARLVVEVSLRPGWHMYGRDVGGGAPVELTVLPGSSFAAVGQRTTSMDAEGKLTGDATIALQLKRTAPGDALRVRFSYCCCDPMACLPPGEVTLVVLPARKVLLVTLPPSADEARAKRIAAFLQARRCVVTHAVWGKVAKADADAADVVLTDSPSTDHDAWREAAKARQHIGTFPETTTPIVATGYLGAELLEHLKIAMTSGYI